MDDLIDDVGIDAKHSYEDVIMPVWEAKKKWGHRMALIGGVDMDVLARGTEDKSAPTPAAASKAAPPAAATPSAPATPSPTTPVPTSSPC